MRRSFIKRVILAFLATMFLIGCSDKDPEIENAELFITPELEGAPKWVERPVVEGSIAAVGIAQRNAGNDMVFQREVAQADGSTNISNQLEIKINSIFNVFIERSESDTNSTFDELSSQVALTIATNSLASIEMSDIWVNKFGTLYVLMLLDTATVVREIEDAIKISFKDEESIYQQYLLSRVRGELVMELER